MLPRICHATLSPILELRHQDIRVTAGIDYVIILFLRTQTNELRCVYFRRISLTFGVPLVPALLAFLNIRLVYFSPYPRLEGECSPNTVPVGL